MPLHPPAPSLFLRTAAVRHRILYGAGTTCQKDTAVSKMEEKILSEVGEQGFPKSVESMISDSVDLRLCELHDCMEKCKSPIEQMMAIAINEWLKDKDALETEFRLQIEIKKVQAQEPIKMKSGKTYIPDFTIPVFNHKYKRTQAFIVECDGHEFHERTKEQVSRDNTRERELMAAGYVVIRFSGSEIYKDPFHCGFEVLDIIFHHCGKKSYEIAED